MFCAFSFIRSLDFLKKNKIGTTDTTSKRTPIKFADLISEPVDTNCRESALCGEYMKIMVLLLLQHDSISTAVDGPGLPGCLIGAANLIANVRMTSTQFKFASINLFESSFDSI